MTTQVGLRPNVERVPVFQNNLTNSMLNIDRRDSGNVNSGISRDDFVIGSQPSNPIDRNTKTGQNATQQHFPPNKSINPQNKLGSYAKNHNQHKIHKPLQTQESAGTVNMRINGYQAAKTTTTI